MLSMFAAIKFRNFLIILLGVVEIWFRNMDILRKVLLSAFFEVTRQVNPGHVQVSPRLKEECYHFFFLTFPTCTIVTRSTIEATKDCSSKATLATSAIVPIATSAADDTRTVAKKYRGPKVNQRALFKIFNQWKSLQNQYIFVLKKSG